MKAVILASGVGTRFSPVTHHQPKCLIKVNGRSILARILDSLIENGIKDILITTGHLEEKIKNFIKENYPKLKVTYVFNPKYKETNYIYSLWLAKDKLKNTDILLLHGDLIYDSVLLEKTIVFPQSSVLLNKIMELPIKDFKGRVKDGRVTEIGVNVFGKDAYFLMPLYKLFKKDLALWFLEIENFVKNGKVTCYAENAFNKVSDKMRIRPLFYTKESCMEIDNLEDLQKAEKIFPLKKGVKHPF